MYGFPTGDVQVDRMVSIVIRVVQSLYRVEDKIILNDSASLYKRHENISLEKVSNCYQMLQKILSDVNGLVFIYRRRKLFLHCWEE